MKKSILKELYFGKIYPDEQIVCNNNPEYIKARDKLAKVKEQLMKNLTSEEDRENLLNLDDLLYELIGIECFEGFAYGFKLAVKLMAESFKEIDTFALNEDE